MRPVIVVVGLLGVVLLGAACSDVRVLKVPTPTQYDVWNDEKQACADRMEGFRFYAQRPFVVVNEPFPLTARSYVVDGWISPDRNNVVITPPKDETLCGVLKTCMQCTEAKKALGPQGGPEAGPEAGPEGGGYVFPYSAVHVRGGPQAGGPQAEEETGAEQAQPEEPPTLIVPPAPGSVGITDFGVRVSNAPYPMTTLRRYIDIVNLPDFDEQFVVRRYQGLGSVSSDLTLGQGHILQGFNANVNNEAIATLTLGLIQSGAQALRGAGLSALGLSPLPGGTTALVPGAGGGPESAMESVGQLGYEPISLVITVAYFATPGLYPIMKPREVRDWQRLGAFHLRYHSSAIACPLEDGGLAIKLGPYGIPYRTFQYVLVEKAATGPTGYEVISRETPEQQPSVTRDEAIEHIKTKILKSQDYDVTIEGPEKQVVVHVKKDRGGAVVPFPSPDVRSGIADSIGAYVSEKKLGWGDVRLPPAVTQYQDALDRINTVLRPMGWEVTAENKFEDGGAFTVKMAEAPLTSGTRSEREEAEREAQDRWENFIAALPPPSATRLVITAP